MYNIKIKSVPSKAKTGQQLDYSLVDRNTLFMKPDTQVQSDVKNTISAVPREEANIEAEGGETVIGDTNNDGFLEHQTIVGKRHSKGGVPLNVPEGSFIFSDTDKLKIKDPEIFNLFGMAANKKGYTPAEIAKKYQVNDYMAILKDDTKDKYSKETAQVMLDSNLKKLGMLALVQESMKGFPDGVPAIAESVMEGMMGGAESEQQEFEQGQPQQRYGGTQLPKAQEGTSVGPYGKGFWESDNVPNQTVEEEETSDVVNAYSPIPLDEVVVTKQKFSDIPKIGDLYYVDNQPIKISDIEESTTGDWLPNWLNDPSGVYFSPQGTTDYGDKNKKYYLSFDEFKKLREIDPATGGAPILKKQGRTASSWWTADENRAYNFSGRPTTQPSRIYGSGENKIVIDKDDVLKTDKGNYKVIDTQYGVGERNPLVEPKGFFLPQQYLETIRVKNLDTGKTEELRLDELKDKMQSGFAKNLTKFPEVPITNGSQPVSGEMNISAQEDTGSMGTAASKKTDNVGKTAIIKNPVINKPRVTEQTPQVQPSFGGFETAVDTTKGYKYGGDIYKMQVGGTAKFNPDTGMYQKYDAAGNPVGTPYKGAGTTYNVKDKDLLEKAKAAGYEVIGNKYAPNINYIPEQTSKTGFTWNPESGYYENKQFPIGKQGLEENVNVWKDELEQYSGPSGKGVEAWKKDFISQKGKEGEASKYLVNKANEYSVAAGAGPQVDVTQKAAYVPGQDVFSLKKFKKAPAQIAQPVNTPTIERGAPEIMQQAITPTIGRKTRGWFTPDMLNLANAFGRKIGRFPPTLQQVALESGPYNLLSPASDIARIQSSASQLGEQAMNTMPANVALAASTGIQGQALERIGDTSGKYGNTNVGISTDASRYGSGVANQQAMANAQLRDQFAKESAVYRQNLLNEQTAKGLGITRAYNKGWDNSFKGNLLEDMFPQVGIDRVYGDIGYSGVGRNPFVYDPYTNPMTGSGKSSRGRSAQDYDFDENDMDQYEKLFNMASTKMSKENAHKFALQGITANKKSRSNEYDPYDPVAGMSEGLGNMFG